MKKTGHTKKQVETGTAVSEVICRMGGTAQGSGDA